MLFTAFADFVCSFQRTAVGKSKATSTSIPLERS